MQNDRNTIALPRLRIKTIRAVRGSRSQKATMAAYFALSTLFLYFGFIFSNNNDWEIAGLYVCGMSVWPLTEYLLLITGSSTKMKHKKIEAILSVMQGWLCKARYNVLLPPLKGIVVAALLLSLLYCLLGPDALCLMAGIANGYVFYACVHHEAHRCEAGLLLSRLKIQPRESYRYPQKYVHIPPETWNKLLQNGPSEKNKKVEKFYSLN